MFDWIAYTCDASLVQFTLTDLGVFLTSFVAILLLSITNFYGQTDIDSLPEMNMLK